MVAEDLEEGRMPRWHTDNFQSSKTPRYDTTVESINRHAICPNPQDVYLCVRVSSEVSHGLGGDNDVWKPEHM